MVVEITVDSTTTRAKQTCQLLTRYTVYYDINIEEMVSSSLETAPVKTVQLDGKVIAITGANRGMCNATHQPHLSCVAQEVSDRTV